MFRKIRRYIKDPYHSIGYEMFRKYPQLMSDKYYLSILWEFQMGYRLDWNHLETYNEKLQWLKLYDRKAAYTKMVDKYRVKQWVAEKIGKEYVIPTLAVYNSVDEIDVTKLPNQFVLKCNHDSGSVIICENKEKFDIERAKMQLKDALGENFYWRAREWPYKNVKPCIFAEQFIRTNPRLDKKNDNHSYTESELKIIHVDMDCFRWNKSRMYSGFWSTIEEEIGTSRNNESASLSNEMFDFLGRLNEEYGPVQGEFYQIDNDVYFGDLTYNQESVLEKKGTQWIAESGCKIIVERDVSDRCIGLLISKNRFVLYFHQECLEQNFAGLKDYKFFCFNGTPKVMYIANDSAQYPTMNFYDMDFEPLPLYTRDPPAMISPDRPRHFEKMKTFAEILSENIPQVRVDFYENGDKLFFGEMTFYHMGGFSEIHPREWNLKMGSWIELPMD